jgi:hypothetical protein
MLGLLLMLGFFMVSLSFAVAFAFHAVRGMYLHAERLLAKAGRQGARGGVSPTRSKAEGEAQAEVCTSEARKTVGKPLVPRQGSALSKGLVSIFVRVSAHDFQGRVAAGTGRRDRKRRTRKRSQRGKMLLPHPSFTEK